MRRQMKIVGGIVALLLVAGVPTVLTYADSSPVHATEVPTSIPLNGVNINNQVTLLPITPAGTASSPATISAAQAVAIARTYVNAQKFPATTLQANVTVPGSVPPPHATDASQATIIHSMPSWVVTFTSLTPTKVMIGGSFPHAKTRAHVPLMSHLSIVINAKTGKFVVGFFTH